MTDEPTPATPQPGTPQTDVDAPAPDQARRRFFRDFAGELLHTAATVAGAASVLQRSSIAAASALLDPEGTAQALAAAETGSGGVALPAGFRTSFRFDTDTQLLVVDQRRIPEALVEYEVRSAGHAAYAIRQRVVEGGPACAQVAAIGLALSAHGVRESPPAVLRATLKAAASAVKVSRPPLRSVTWAVDRMMDRFEDLVANGADGVAVAVALRHEADRIVAESTVDNGRIAEMAAAALPDTDDRPLRVLTHGTSGALSGGQFGTAIGALQALHHGGRSLHVWVAESRPLLTGSRVTAWELAQVGVPHTVVIDAAAGYLIANGEVDAVIVAADRIAANGDVVAAIGTYPLAALASRHEVPFLVCAALSALDAAAPTGSAVTLETRPERELVAPNLRPAPATMPLATAVSNPAFDITPTDLIGTLITEEGALGSPRGAALIAATEARARRWAEADATSGGDVSGVAAEVA